MRRGRRDGPQGCGMAPLKSSTRKQRPHQDCPCASSIFGGRCDAGTDRHKKERHLCISKVPSCIIGCGTFSILCAGCSQKVLTGSSDSRRHDGIKASRSVPAMMAGQRRRANDPAEGVFCASPNGSPDGLTIWQLRATTCSDKNAQAATFV